VTLTTPVRLKRVGREMKMLVGNSNDDLSTDLSLLKIVARAHDSQAGLAENSKLTVHGVAHAERLSAGYLYALLRLPWLAPDITTAIVNGWQPLQLKALRYQADWTIVAEVAGVLSRACSWAGALDSEVHTTQRGFRKATSVYAALTGLGGDCFIIDDPQKPVDAQSDSQRNRLNQWFSNTLISRLDNKEIGFIIIVMQRVHREAKHAVSRRDCGLRRRQPQFERVWV
jgi:hypothetical protein